MPSLPIGRKKVTTGARSSKSEDTHVKPASPRRKPLLHYERKIDLIAKRAHLGASFERALSGATAAWVRRCRRPAG